jgi:two-component system response regulator
MTDQMTRRPRRVSGSAPTGFGGAPLVPTVLLADGDENARSMVRDALLEGTGPCDLRTVAGAGELADYLHGRADPAISPRPSLIIVDLDLPGTETAIDAVRGIKASPELRRIPVVVIARHASAEQTAAAYDAGANTLIAKPVSFLGLVKLMKVFTAYWLDAAQLPPAAA